MEAFVEQINKDRSKEDEEMVFEYEVQQKQILKEKEEKLRGLLKKVEQLPRSL